MTFLIKTSSSDKHKLLAYLKKYHTGRDNAAKKREILTHLYGSSVASDESYNSVPDRKLRKMVEELINEGKPICSSAKCGYWYAASLNDGMASVTENKSRALTQLENVKRLEQNILNEYGGQIGMFQ